MRLRRVFVFAATALVATTGGAWLLVPETVRPWVARARDWVGSLPRPVVLGAIVEGRQPTEYETTYAPRVGVTTHELLHNVASRVNGQSHTSSGWLEGGGDDEYLSEPTARELNQSGLFGPVH